MRPAAGLHLRCVIIWLGACWHTMPAVKNTGCRVTCNPGPRDAAQRPGHLRVRVLPSPRPQQEIPSPGHARPSTPARERAETHGPVAPGLERGFPAGKPGGGLPLHPGLTQDYRPPSPRYWGLWINPGGLVPGVPQGLFLLSDTAPQSWKEAAVRS